MEHNYKNISVYKSRLWLLMITYPNPLRRCGIYTHVKSHSNEYRIYIYNTLGICMYV